jgi:transposase
VKCTWVGRSWGWICIGASRCWCGMTEAGERLETVRISNDPEYLRAVMARAGKAPEVVLEATYGWYWAADVLAELGAKVYLAHPLGMKMFSYRRVKTMSATRRIWRICCGWVGCLKRGSLRRATRELRELVRHRKLCRRPRYADVCVTALVRAVVGRDSAA